MSTRYEATDTTIPATNDCPWPIGALFYTFLLTAVAESLNRKEELHSQTSLLLVALVTTVVVLWARGNHILVEVYTPTTHYNTKTTHIY
jgi:hypothetical protein